MTAQFPAFVVVDRVTGLNLDYLKFCPLHYGSDCYRELLNCVSTNCGEYREMKIVKSARYVGTMIGPEGYLRGKLFREPSAPDEATLKKESHLLVASLLPRTMIFLICYVLHLYAAMASTYF